MESEKVIIDLSVYNELLDYKDKLTNNNNIYINKVGYLGVHSRTWILGDEVVEMLKEDNRKYKERLNKLLNRSLIQRILNKQ